jgi:hypothetical protein
LPGRLIHSRSRHLIFKALSFAAKVSFDGCIGRTVSTTFVKNIAQNVLVQRHGASITVGAAISLTVPLPMPIRR